MRLSYVFLVAAATTLFASGSAVPITGKRTTEDSLMVSPVLAVSPAVEKRALRIRNAEEKEKENDEEEKTFTEATKLLDDVMELQKLNKSYSQGNKDFVAKLLHPAVLEKAAAARSTREELEQLFWLMNHHYIVPDNLGRGKALDTYYSQYLNGRWKRSEG
uniref:RxLR effector protein n=1 Tax=Phytophthora brassicae TaxID=187813 RepID=A0A7G8FQJ4_PHYBB|nr:RxLR3 effector [Phytophthora brassicae]